MKRYFIILTLLLSSAAMADTASDRIAAGRTALLARDLPAARARFQEAVTAAPTNQTAAALLGITRLFDITSQASTVTFLTGLGLPTAGRNAYAWTSRLPEDSKGEAVLPANYNLAQAQAYWRDALVAESVSARTNLAAITDPNFLITLTAAETTMPMSVNLDYGDVLMARACLRGAEFLAHLGAGANLSANLDAINQLAKGDLLTIQRVLNANLDLLKAGSSAERTAAKAALLDMIALYRQASVVIRARPAGITRLFMLETKALAAEAELRQMLDKIEQSLSQPVQVGEKYAFFGQLFDPNWSLRAQLPVFSASGFDITTIPDASLGGVLSGFSKEDIARAISNKHDTLAEIGWEWVSPKPQGNSMLRYRYLPSGKHLATGNGGSYMTSPDGTNWTVGRIPGAGALQGLAFNSSGKIVTVSYDGSIYASSDDAVSWHRVHRSGNGFNSVAYGNGKFVAVADYGLVATSADGETWYESHSNYYTMQDVTYNGSRFIAVGIDPSTNNAVIATSTDGQFWDNRLSTNLSNFPFWGVASNGNTVVAVGFGNIRALSVDGGLNWTTGTLLASGTTKFLGVSYANGTFVAVGAAGTIVTSTDGATWTQANSGETFLNLVGVGPGNGGRTYVVCAGGVVLTSTNNTSFSRSITGFSTAGGIGNVTLLALRAIDGQLFVSGGFSTGTDGVILRSTDGQSFSVVNSGTNDIWDIIKQGTTYYAVGTGGTILTSANGTTWTAQTTGITVNLRSISYLNGQFIVLGANNTIRTSPDGINWTARTTALTGGTFYGAAYGNGTYVVVGGNNVNNGASHVVTSPDGVTWTVRNANTPNTFRGIVFYQGTFTAVGTNGQVSRSTDGINWWNASPNEASTNILGISVLNGRYYATLSTAGANGSFESQSALLVSSNGENWVRVPQGTNLGQYHSELFLNRIYTSGNGSSILRTQALTAPALPTVQVLSPATATTQVAQGGALALVTTTTGEGGLVYQWKKGGTDIAGANTSGLTLKNIQASDAGSYTLTVTNSAGTATSSPIAVTVSSTAAVPVITSHPKSQTVGVGLNATLSVEATGTTPLAYAWKKDGVTVTDGGNVIGATTATITFMGLQASNGGTYTAVVSNAAGSVTSLGAALTVDSNPVYVYSTVAGSPGVFATTDGTGSAARFDNPHGVAVDSAGNIYVSSPQSHTIRKVTSAGVVTTIAGLAYATGVTDAVGTASRFNGPRGVALDAAGANLYVADTNNGKIRKILLSSGAVSSFATVPSPTAVVLDSSGNVYTTGYDHSIRKITSAGVVSTFAGAAGQPSFLNGTGTSARFNNPVGIAIDSIGNLYVADQSNTCIRKITSAGVVTTYAGVPNYYGNDDGPLGVATMSNVSGVAVDAAGNVFVTDNSSGIIRKISTSQIVRTIGGSAYNGGFNDGSGSNARFNGPAGIAVDSAGNLFIAENYNHIVRKGMPLTSTLAPIIGVSPQSQTVAVGGNVAFSVNASGASTLSYQWRKDGVAISGATSATLSLTNVQLAAAGSYSVLVSSAQGAALSAPATLTVTVPPTITVQPSAASVTAGLSASFSVTATDAGYLTYQWRRNGVNIPGAIYSTFTLPVARRTDAGIYDVVINGIKGVATSGQTQLSVAPTRYPGEIAYDPSFNASPLLTISARILAALALPDGKWLVGGEFLSWNSTPRTFLARLNSDYSLDSTFTPPLINGFVYALARGSDGLIYVGGEFTAVEGKTVPGLFRLNASFALDTAWRVQDSPPNASITALAVQADGKVLVARQSTQAPTTGTNVLRRLNTDGTADSSFSVNIVSNGSRLNVVVAEPAGAIAFAGAFASVNGITRNGLARVDTTGATLDTIFGGTAGTNGQVFSLTRLASGSYLVAGGFTTVGGVTRNRVAILNADGSLNTTFVPVTFGGNALGAAQLADGRVMVAGPFTSANGQATDGMVRLTTLGAVDALFTSGGSVTSFAGNTTSRTMYVFPQTDGSTAIFGSFSAALNQRRVGLAVITSSGNLASSPAPQLLRPSFTGSAYAVEGSKTVVFGSIDYVGSTGPLGQAVRLNDNGSLDSGFPLGSGFGLNGLSTFGIYRAVRQGDGKFLAVGDLAGYNGSYAFRMARIGADGSFDSSFYAGSGPSTVFPPILALSGGRTLLYGLATGYTYNSQSVVAFARLNKDGSLDGSFSQGTGLLNGTGSGSINFAGEQPDGKLVLAGSFNSYNGTTVANLIRLNPDGTLDSTFVTGTGLTGGTAGSGLCLADGRILLAGSFTGYNGTAVNRMVMLTAGGTIDANFTAPAVIDNTVGQILPQEDGKFILVGDFAATPSPYAARLNANGSLDSTFALRGITGGFGSGSRIFMGEDGSIYVHNTVISCNYGVPVAFARFRGAPSAPGFATAPASASLNVGGSVTLSFRPTGTAPFTYQWNKGGVPIQGATNSTLTLSSVQSSATGSYSVTVTNSIAATESPAATITVNVAPAITVGPVTQTVTAGTPVVLSVTASGSAPLTYQWKKGATVIDGATNPTLVFANPQVADSGSYTVTVTNPLSSATSTAATLTVNALAVAPTITSQPVNQTVTAGGNAVFIVTASGTAPLAYQWFLGPTAVSGATSDRLTITNAQAANAGSYTVVVSNGVNPAATSTAAVLTVNPVVVAPAITTQPVGGTVTAGTSVTFTVVATGTVPGYQWLRNGNALASATNATLTLASPQVVDSGSYSVVVTNSAGTAFSSTALLTVNPAGTPPALTTAPVSQTVTAGTSVTFTVAASGTAPLAYLWRKNGAALTTATSATLALINVQSTDGASYTVRVSNPVGDVISAPATLTVNPLVRPPALSAASTIATPLGTAFSYQLVASGTPTSWSATGLPTGLTINTTTGLITGTPTASGTFVVTLGATNAGGTGNATLTLNVVAPAPVVSSSSTAAGRVGAAFTYTVTATNTPTSFGATGLPAGLTLNSTSGVISGTPTADGIANVSLTATNAGGTSTAYALTLTLAPSVNVPVVTGDATATGKVGDTFVYVITASNTPTAYAATSLPAGLAVSPTNGLVTGRPTAAGSFTMNVTASNVAGTSTALAVLVTIDPAATAPVISSSTSATATAGTAFTYAITASNTPTAYTATGLPAGLTVSATTGAITGTPTAAATSAVLLGATNAGGTGTAALLLTVVPGLSAPVITSSSSVRGKVGDTFTYATLASNTPTAFAATDVPAGLTYNSGTGILSGTPTAAGTSTVTLTAANAAGTSAAFALTVNLASALAAPVITSDATASATQGTLFTYQITASNTPLTGYGATGLPAGLALNPLTGVITGTPSTAASYAVVLTASNAAGTSAPLGLLLAVQPSAQSPTVTSSLTADGNQGRAFAYQVTASNMPLVSPLPAGNGFTATGLPAGLALNSATGAIVGTPTRTGSYNVRLTATNDTGTSAAKTLVIRIAPALNAPVINSGTTADATAGTAFTYRIAGYGTPGRFDVADRPAWLAVDTTTGIISGTPTAPGTYTVTMSATNAVGTSNPVTLTITAAPAAGSPVVTSTLSATGPATGAFTYQIGAGPGPITGYFANARLPEGVALDSTTGILSGTPTTPGAYTIAIGATNAAGIGGTKDLVVTIAAAPGSPVVGPGLGGTAADRRITALLRAALATTLTASGTVNTAFTYQIIATNSPSGYLATNLPAGLALNPGTGLISGLPTTAGTSTAQIGAVNSIGIGGTVPLVITIAAPLAAPAITSTLAASGTVGAAFTYTVTASNTPTSYNAAGLPAGLSLNATSGAISGAPTTPGVYHVTLSANNNAGTGATADLVLTIAAAASAPVISSAATKTGTVGAALTAYQITASNTPTSYTAAGLPPGVTLNSATGAITGTPTLDGQFTASLTATNAAGASTPFTLTFTIAPSAATAVITSTTSATVVAGASFTYLLSATNSPVSYNISAVPAGLTANPTAGLISGIPTAPGAYTVTLSANNLAGTGPAVTLALTVNPNDGSSSIVQGARLINLATRGLVGTGDNVMIVGFVIDGTVAKPVIIRGVGPTLGGYGVPGTLPDPQLRLFNGANAQIDQNDNWGTIGNQAALTADMARVGAFAFASALESVVYTTLAPGLYTAQLSGNGAVQTGVGIVEVYDNTVTLTTTSPRLVNVSTRGLVGTGDNILIAGLVITGDQPKQVLIRGVGPTLGDYGVPGTLSDPYLTLLNSDRVVIRTNDNWGTSGDEATLRTAAATVGAFALASGSKDAVILVTLPPGLYTMQVSGVANATGVAIVEAYELP